MSILHNIFFFIVAIGLLVTFHEFGHFWVARKAGVKVLRFSIGFGKALLSWKRKSHEGDEIEYVIAAIPLGGYVKMLDEREGPVADAEKSRAFNNQSVAKRIAIVIAGPAFNFILAIVLYWLVFMMGATVDRPIVAQPEPDTITAAAGFEARDEVLMVGDDKVRSWNEFRLEILEHGLNGGILQIRVIAEDGNEYIRQLNLGDLQLLEDDGDIFERIGFTQWWPDLLPQIGGVVEGGAAEKAGILKDDIILQADGVEIDEWTSLVEMIRKKPDQKMDLVVLRGEQEQAISVVPQSREIEQGELQGYIGAYQLVPDEIRDLLISHIEYDVSDAFFHAITKTWDMSILTLRVLWKMISGQASLSNISGPITIATYAGVTASIGMVSFLSFLAVISVSLGVLNLLPIPMLDGGHLLYYLIEIVKGSPVSEMFELRGQQIGMAFLAMLMSIAIFNDIQRLIQ